MAKTDLKQALKHLYSPSKKEFTIVDVPPMNFLMIDGHGDPNNNPEFQEMVGALYAMSYTLKFAIKKAGGQDFTVQPLEGLWWTSGETGLDLTDKREWDWTVMIMQPDWVTPEQVEQARAEVAAKRNPPLLPRVRFERYHEGLSVQILYLGAYSDEGPTILRMHAFAREQGYELRGKHHEIYIGDPRRTAPEKLKTVIRQPIRKRE